MDKIFAVVFSPETIQLFKMIKACYPMWQTDHRYSMMLQRLESARKVIISVHYNPQNKVGNVEWTHVHQTTTGYHEFISSNFAIIPAFKKLVFDLTSTGADSVPEELKLFLYELNKMALEMETARRAANRKVKSNPIWASPAPLP